MATRGRPARWYERLPRPGTASPCSTSVLLENSDLGQARRWYEQAAKAGHAGAMINLGVLLEDGDPGQARRWYGRPPRPGT